jgi:hypothetical protein
MEFLKKQSLETLIEELECVREDVNLQYSSINKKILEIDENAVYPTLYQPIDKEIDYLIQIAKTWDYETLNAFNRILNYKQLQSEMCMRTTEEQEEYEQGMAEMMVDTPIATFDDEIVS